MSRALTAASTAILAIACASGGTSETKKEDNDLVRPAPTRIAPSPSQPDPVQPAPAPAKTAYRFGCAATTPEGACASLRKTLGAAVFDKSAKSQLAPCGKSGETKVGAWRYALIAPSYTVDENVSLARLLKMWRGTDSIKLQVATAAQPWLSQRWGAGTATTIPKSQRTEPSEDRWLIIAAHDLQPHWKVIEVDNTFPIGPDSKKSALAMPLCLSNLTLGGLPPAVNNITPGKLTRMIITSVTALTRNTAVLIDRKGPLYPAKTVKPWFKGADFVHISNEVSFTPKCKTVTGGISFCSKDHYIKTLEELNANIIELTGSHLTDFKRKWLTRTVDMYAKRGWKWFGGGRSQIEATRPLVIEHNGNKIGFVGCNIPRTDEKWIRSGPSVAFCDYRRVLWQVRDMTRRGIVPIVSIQHWEIPSFNPSSRIVKEFRKFAEAGARFVFGSQAHQPKPWEVHHGAFIHYGAGNFLFDQVGDKNRQGTVDRLYFHGNRLLTVEQRHTWTEDRGRPTWMSDRRRARYIRAMKRSAKKIARRGRVKPWAPITGKPPTGRHRPDSFLSGKHPQKLWVYVPKGAATVAGGAEKWPLVIFLHGQDELGGDMGRIKTKALPKFLEANPDKYPFFVASPHMSKNRSKRGKHTLEAIDFMIAKYPIDPARVYITGFSLGALYAWKIATRNPKRFAAIAAVSGFSDSPRACAVKDVPAWAFHGTKDFNVPNKASRKMIAAIKKCGGTNAKLTIYEGVDHEGAWAKAYADPELYKWLLAQKRPTPK